MSFNIDESWGMGVLLRVIDDLLDEINDLKSVVDRLDADVPYLKPEHKVLSTATSKKKHPNPFEQIATEVDEIKAKERETDG